jgi:predicted permease
VGEIAVALAVLSGAGYLTQAMDHLVNRPSGFNAERLLTFELALPPHKYPEAKDIRLFEREALRELAAIPGVGSVALMGSLPRSMSNPRTSFQVEGQEELEVSERPRTNFQQVNPDYFRTLEIPLRSGRLLEESDREDAAPVVVVNQEFIQQYLADAEPLGQRIEILGESREIVGVVDNILQSRLTLDGQAETGVYLPFSQVPGRLPRFAVRTTGDPTLLSADVRSAIWSVDPDQPIALVQTLEEHIRLQMAGPQFLSVFVFVLGGLAMILSAMGIWGVMAHSVIQERREIGIRLAMGAQGSQVVRMVTRRGLLLTAVGLIAGTPLALLIYRRVLSALNLFEVEMSPTYALVAGATLIAVAALASYMPARRAAKVDPVVALQAE